MSKTMKVLAILMLAIAVVIAAGCKKEKPEPEPNNGGNGEEPELTANKYLGVIGFSGTLVVKEIALLDESSVGDFEGFINNLIGSDGSALYYSEYEALKMLQSSIEPPQLNNVSLVTVTAGLDNVSIASEETNPENYATNEEYRIALNQSIMTNTVHGKSINAYTIGLLTDEAQSDLDEFRANLGMLASREENVYEVENMDQAKERLSEIANTIDNITGENNSSLIVLVLDNRMKEAAHWFIRPRPINPIQTYTIGVSAEPSNGGAVSGGGTFQEGQTCTVNAIPNNDYTFVNWTENDILVTEDESFTFTVNGNRSLVAHFTKSGGGGGGTVPPGAAVGVFTVGTGKPVYFSHGNLQYQASTDTWRFAENQYDILAEANANISSTYSGWIDLFGWGTSGYHNESDIYNIYYQPYSSFFGVAFSQEPGYTINRTGYGPSYGESLVGSNASYDWGINNAISNGGGEPNQWRTLTQDEWNYVVHVRSTSSGIRYAKAQVNGVAGIILLPDDWSTSVYSLNNTNTSNASYDGNDISEAVWKSVLEPNGAVFFPAAGVRMETSVIMGTSYSGPTGFYWSVDPYTGSSDERRATCALGFGFAASAIQADDDSDSFRASGCSVRLVRNVQ